MGIISSATGENFSDQDIKDWFAAAPRSNADVAKRSSELGLDQSQITTALSTGRNVVQNPDNVNAWVADTNNGYQWDAKGGLQKTPLAKPPIKQPPALDLPPVLAAPTGWNVTPEQTVEGRISGIINGTVGQQARGRAMGMMNERGLTNSSIAISAGEDAAYNAAIPIATADAATFAKAAGYNSDQSNQFATKRADIATQYGLAEMADRNRLDITRINDATTRSGQADQVGVAKINDATTRSGQTNQMDIAKLNAATNTSIATMENLQKTTALQLQFDNKTLLETNQQAATAFGNGMQAVNTINLNDKMDANTKTQAVAQVWRDVTLQMTVIGGVTGLELKTRNALKNYPGFNESGVYVGFNAEGNTLGTPLTPAAVTPAAVTPATTTPAAAPLGIVAAPQPLPLETS